MMRFGQQHSNLQIKWYYNVNNQVKDLNRNRKECPPKTWKIQGTFIIINSQQI